MPTYHDVARAFTALETRHRVIARHNFLCCQSCGYAAMEQEIKNADIVPPVIGVTFYHEQDTESAAKDGTLYLIHSAAENDVSDAQAALVSYTIVTALRDAGFAPVWSGSRHQRIQIAIDADSMARQFPDALEGEYIEDDIEDEDDD